MIADSEEKLKEVVSIFDEECRRMVLKINIGKTKVMRITKASGRLPVNIKISGEAIK